MIEESYKYKFSIVMAVYNVENYIAEAIDSLIEQENINFIEDVQVILVNDGSPDNSEEVCLKYKELYPDNIVYIKKENGGVSSARNKGLEFVEGKYVNFLDPDDKLASDCLYKVYDFFEENYEYIDIVTIPLCFFGAIEGNHQLNRKFKGDRVIDILSEPYSILYSSSSSFVKYTEIKENIFNQKLKYAEDAQFINKIILNKCMYGSIASTKYLYRRRDDGSSAIDNSGRSKEWYTDYFREFSLYMINYSIQNNGYILKYVQYLIMHDLQWRIKVKSLDESLFTKDETNEIIDYIKNILSNIDNDIIKNINMEIWYKIFALRMKYCKPNIKLQKSKYNAKLYIDDIFLFDLRNSTLAVQNVDIKDNNVIIEGYSEVPLYSNEYSIVAYSNKEKIISQSIDRKDKEIIALDFSIADRQGFKFEIPIDANLKHNEIKLYIEIDNSLIRPKIWIDKFVKLYSFINRSYFIKDKYAVIYVHNSFTIIKPNVKVKLGLNYRFTQELIKRKKYKIAIYRQLINILKVFKYKPIWIFMDRVNKADDNAEHLFKYANLKHDGIKKYFILDKNSSDFSRISEYGKVIEYGSKKHKLYLLLADKVISSHAADFARMQFLGEGRILSNLQDFKFIFLQHGIIKDDVSIHLNKYNRQLDMFVTSANKEYESILNGDYHYSKNEVKLTGLPRYDNLIDNNNNQIFIIPTWRANIVAPIDSKTGKRRYSSNFKNTEYYKRYNDLLNEKRLLETAQKYGYSIKFYPHPEIYQQIDDFNRNDVVDFINLEESYQKLINESSILITDYSSIFFDFAYLKKPVIYYHWDDNHYDEGYFDYEAMGFGEVCNDYEILVDNIVKYIENDCKMKEEYKQRVDEFYAYTDKNNCERVYNEIINMK